MSYDPTFSTDISDINRNNIIYVNSINSFRDRVGNIVTVENGTRYNFTEDVDLDEIEFVGTDGATVIFSAENIISNTIISRIAGSSPLFSGDFARLIIDNIDVSLTSGSGQLFDITSSTSQFPVIEINVGVLRGGGADFGVIQGSLIDFNGCIINDWNSGLVFGSNGNLGRTGIKIKDSIFSDIEGTHITVQGTQSFVQIDKNFSVPNSGQAFLNLDPGITKQVVDEDSIFVTTNTVDSSLGGKFLENGSLDGSAGGVIFFANTTQIQSNFVGSTTFTAGTTETVLADTSTFVKIAGTYVNGYLERFAFVDGVGTYTGLEPIQADFICSVKLSLEPGIETDVIEVALFKNGIQGNTVQQALTAVFQTPTSPEFDPMENVLCETGDTFELRIRNISNATNITVTDAKIRVKK